MSRRQRSAIIIAFAFVFALAGIAVALAIPPCWEINDFGWCDFVCMNDGGCAAHAEICMGYQGYIRSTCGNGAVYLSICSKNCGSPPPPPSGSPIFKKPDVMEAEHP